MPLEHAPPRPRILLLEDSLLDAELISEHLAKISPAPEILRVSSRPTYVQALEKRDFDVILSDFSLPDFDGMSALELAAAQVPDVPFIFVSGVLGEEMAIDAFRRGATDYVLKQRLIRLPAAVERALAEARERTERRRAEHQKELLVRELSHRVKNTMAMVMSIVRRTAKNSGTVESYVENLSGRLRAMADAHALLFESNWTDAELLQVLERTIAPHEQGNRFEIDAGPVIHLDPKAALALSLAFNELMTNAIKYGALSHADGRVAIGWTRDEIDGEPWLSLHWREIDGPAVRPPQEDGFGTTLIQRSIRYELRGETVLDYAVTGLVCDIRFPLSQQDGNIIS
ncbi:two-component sensor histidine kinase/CheY-like chemotaxis protein [Neorhizobium huautlense]|uniref:histidine kinase n=1 Tax=Neorhizobium huautlense TaxID=67774 RepID=A0ABT9PLZ5_9HYPH|nr:HWE histidine kinase domain-containing protein [Neorhizobium huautlense]MDP9835484.1 two-component sensor histidine kinase/CheY-like chemotaxis protein [Neorhizobium huautlense]